MSEDEYRQAPHEPPVPEFRDEELAERDDATFLYGMTQGQLGSFFSRHRQHGPVSAISASHVPRLGLVRIPDVIVHQGMPTMPGWILSCRRSTCSTRMGCTKCGPCRFQSS